MALFISPPIIMIMCDVQIAYNIYSNDSIFLLSLLLFIIIYITTTIIIIVIVISIISYNIISVILS